jgi:uncharacterized protein (DUF302 family)
LSGDLSEYKFERVISDSVDKVFSRLSQRLKDSGYVILSIVDVRETLSNSGLDKNFKPFYILDVCKPKAAHLLIGSNDEYGLLLPCKIMLTSKNSGTVVEMLKVSELASRYLNENREMAAQFEKELISAINSI